MSLDVYRFRSCWAIKWNLDSFWCHGGPSLKACATGGVANLSKRWMWSSKKNEDLSRIDQSEPSKLSPDHVFQHPIFQYLTSNHHPRAGASSANLELESCADLKTAASFKAGSKLTSLVRPGACGWAFGWVYNIWPSWRTFYWLRRWSQALRILRYKSKSSWIYKRILKFSSGWVCLQGGSTCKSRWKTNEKTRRWLYACMCVKANNEYEILD